MSRMVRITLRLDAQLVADIDRQCRRLGCSRSAFIRDALRWHIATGGVLSVERSGRLRPASRDSVIL